MSSEDLPLVIAAAVMTLVWLLVVGAVRVRRQPREPAELEPTLELGPEPPALAGFLAGNFKVRRDAVPATLLDFCARGLAEIKRVDVNTYACELGRDPREALTRYEQRVWDLLRKRVRGGVVPAKALTTGPGDESKRWWRGFVNEVVDEAQERGLSRDLWPRRLALLVGVLAAVPALLLGLAFGEDGFFAYLILSGAGIARVLYGRRQRDTPAGLEAAARWRAVQAKLGEDPVFAEQPPIAVELWERLLAYGAALGVAPAAIRPIPMGAEPDNRAWSTYGGRWHQVDIRFVHGPQWGQHPGWALLSRLALAAFGLLFLWIAGPVLSDVLDDTDGIARLILIGVIAVPLAITVMGAFLALRAAADLFRSKEVTGEIVRLRITRSEGDATGHFVAVDDGTSKEVRAWSVRPEIYAGLEQGQVVTARVTPRLGYVHSIQRAPA
jgi:Predicted membrane protein (DUF2207) C-terminal domain